MNRTIVIIALSLAAACGGGSSSQQSSFPSQRSSAAVASNGRSLNGRSLNGTSLNGANLTGVSFSGVSMAGASLSGLAINGSELTAVTSRGALLRGTAMTGATLTGLFDDGSTQPLSIDEVDQGAGANSDVWFYNISYPTGPNSSASICTDEDGNPTEAIVLAGTWDQGSGTATGGSWSANAKVFTLGCHAGGATAKCVELGYKPWATVGGVSMRDYHQTCTRLIRADYCGNGSSWTQNGRTIDLYDDMSINTDTDPNWIFEAEWTPNGANCVSMIRVINLQNTLGIVDQCILRKVNLSCGSPSNMRGSTTMMNRYRNPDVFGISL